jgi:hypothetical protein
MLERMLEKITGTDPLTRAMRGASPEKFFSIFARSTVLFLQLPAGYENGIDPNVSQDEFMSHMRAGAKDISGREQFTPFRRIRGDHKALLLFTQQRFATEFATAYVRQVNRIMPFGVLGVQGRLALRMLNGVDSVVFNCLTKQEYELPAEYFEHLKTLTRLQAEESSE